MNYLDNLLPMDLPNTREEYTQLALMYGETSSDKNGLFGLLCEGLEGNEDDLGYDIVNWICDTIGKFPDLVEYEYVKEDNDRYAVYVAGVFVFIVINSRIRQVLENLDTIANQNKKIKVYNHCNRVLHLHKLLCIHCYERTKSINVNFTITKDT